MPRLSKTETRVVFDALQRLTACTRQELEEWLFWDDAEIAAYERATGKFALVVDALK
jgi:hypothetical protein